MAYSHIRFIPYHTPTIYLAGSARQELPAGMLLDYREQQTIFEQFPDLKLTAGLVDRDKVLARKPPIYTVKLLGAPDCLKRVKSDADVFSRVQRTLTALELAVTTLESRKDLKKDGVLNIFAMPEFFFRPPDELGSYSEDMYKAIANVLAATIGPKKALKNWLVIPGTIMWSGLRNDPAGLKKKVMVDHNTALLINGGVEFRGGMTVEKYFPVSTDGMPSNRFGYENLLPKDLAFKGEWITTAEYFKRQDMWGNVSEHIIDFRGVRMGMEICADHGMLKSYPFVTKDIVAQLLVSCGRPLVKSNVCTTDNGYFMRIDGYHGAGLRRDFRKINGYGNKKRETFDRWDASSYAEMSPTTLDLLSKKANPYIEHEIPFEKGHPLYWVPPKDANMKDWAFYRQGITFFEPQAI